MGISHNMQCILWFTVPPLLKCFILIWSYQISLNKLGFSSSVTLCFPHTEQSAQNVLFWFFPFLFSQDQAKYEVLKSGSDKAGGKDEEGRHKNGMFRRRLCGQPFVGGITQFVYCLFPPLHLSNHCELDIIQKLLTIHPVQTVSKSGHPLPWK